MADFYIDAANGASGNSGASELLPKALLSQATLSANNRVLLRRGQTHPVATYRICPAGMLVTAYGTGPKPLVQKTAGPDAWMYIQNGAGTIFEHFDVDCNGFTGPAVAVSTGSGAHAISGVILRDIEVYGSTNTVGFFIGGSSGGTVRTVDVEDCISRDHSTHGFIASTDCNGVTFTRCVAHDCGATGDAHGLTSYAPSASPAPVGTKFMYCEAYGILDTSATDIEGQGLQFDDYTSGCEMVGCYSHGNEGAGLCFNNGTAHTVIGCLSVDNQRVGLFITGATTNSFAYNNTFAGNGLVGGASNADIRVTGASTGNTMSNNLLTNTSSKAVGMSFAAEATGGAGATNCIFGYATVSENVTLSGTVSTDPSVADDYTIGTNSSCYRTGTWIQRARDLHGRRLKRPPDIGCFQHYPQRITRSTARGAR